MKKFAAVFMSTLLAAATAMTTVASAASTVDQTQKGSLTLTKYEQKEDRDSVPENEKTVSGAEFTAYKVANLNADGLYTAVEGYKNVSVVDADGTTWTLDKLLTNDKFENTSGGLTYTSSDIFEKLIPGLQEVSTTDDTGKMVSDTEANPGVYKFDNLDLGVYLVVETKVPTGYAVASQSFLVSVPEWDENENGDGGEWKYDVTASPKDSPVNPDKVIVKSETETTDNDTVKIGDKVPYQVTANLPYYGTALPAVSADEFTPSVLYPTKDKFVQTLAAAVYEFKDTMSKGLTYNKDMVITIGDVTLTKDTDYTLNFTTDTATGITTVNVNFVWANINKYQGKEIKFSYSATVNEKAEIGVEGNTNEVQLKYTNDPQTGGDADTNPDTTTVYTYGFDLTKLFNNAEADGTNIDASGVEFSLKIADSKQWFITAESGVYFAYSAKMADDPATDADESVAPTEGGKVTINGVTYTITQKLNPTKLGQLSVDGLDVGTYTFTEENSISGFSKLASDITIVVSESKTDGKIDGKVIAKIGTQELNLKEDNLGVFLFTVNNTTNQFNLPLTGGMGIIMFTVAGGVIIAAAIIIFSQLRKKKKTAVK